MFDTWVHPLMMGLEEHLLDDVPRRLRVPRRRRAVASRRRRGARRAAAQPRRGSRVAEPRARRGVRRRRDRVAGRRTPRSELQKIPFFVRGKARRNTERFASERGVATITVETLYDAKAHFGR